MSELNVEMMAAFFNYHKMPFENQFFFSLLTPLAHSYSYACAFAFALLLAFDFAFVGGVGFSGFSGPSGRSDALPLILSFFASATMSLGSMS